MMFSPDELQQVVAAMQPIDRSPADARREPRVRIRTHVPILVMAGGGVKTVQVQVRDISASGMGLLRSEPMRRDEPFIVSLPSASQPESLVPLLVRVAYWEPLAEGLVSVGCKFVRFLRADEVQNPARTLAYAATASTVLDCFPDEQRAIA
jgi:hypothetical protein